MADLLYKELTYAVIGAAMEVHRVLGSGFLEAVYQKALASELLLRHIPFVEQVKLPVNYKGLLVGEYIADYKWTESLSLKSKPFQDSITCIRRRRCTIWQPQGRVIKIAHI